MPRRRGADCRRCGEYRDAIDGATARAGIPGGRQDSRRTVAVSHGRVVFSFSDADARTFGSTIHGGASFAHSGFQREFRTIPAHDVGNKLRGDEFVEYVPASWRGDGGQVEKNSKRDVPQTTVERLVVRRRHVEETSMRKGILARSSIGAIQDGHWDPRRQTSST